MENFLGVGVMVCRGVVVSMILQLICCSFQVAWAQADQTNFTNIACGSNQSYIDQVTGLTWMPDAPYITTGKIQPNLPAPSYPQNASGMTSLRYFDDPRPKNCYTLPVNESSYYMLRTSFFYGNYDNAGMPPSFQLAIDGNIVANITMGSDSGQYVEFQYSPLGNITFLCLVRTSPLSTPFISGITLVPVNDYVTRDRRDEFANYLGNGYFMKTLTRVTFGGTELIRFPSDTHDWFWYPEGMDSNLLTLTTSPLEILSTTSTLQTYGIPLAVMQTAVTTSGPLVSYFLPVGWTGTESSPTWLSIFWAELNSSAETFAPRTFNVTLPAFDGTITSGLNGSFLATEGYYLWDSPIAATGPNSTMTLTNTNASSSLGPTLSCMELFSISEHRVLKTVDQDALAIENIKLSLGLTEWTGDPCLPYPHSWVTCSSPDLTTVNPKIIALNISGYNLEGNISHISSSIVSLSSLTSLSLDNNKLKGALPDLSFLTNLITLNLANNNLSGPLPDWLTSLKRLRQLSVEKNNFSGPIPTLLLSSDTLDFKYHPGNPLLVGGVQGQSNENSKSNSSNSLAILGATLGSVLGILLLSIIAYFLYPQLKLQLQNVYKGNNQEIGSAHGAKSYTLTEVTAMTRNFNTEIGKGGFGPVYYGKLPDGQEVAVKVADASTRQGKREFFNEVDVLSRVRHKNLVALVGYCQEDRQQILIYEYMKNGSLHDQLYGNTMSTGLLDWKTRLQIAVTAAQGLEYLHTGCSPSFIHRDIKSSNILLSAKYDAKVADFGLTKLMGEAEDTKVLTLVMGTAGYLDPEYYHTHYLSTKSDIYSFGVVLLELITGRQPINRSSSSKSNTNLCDWVRTGLEEGNIEVVLDPAVKASLPTPNHDALWKVTEIALQCVEPKSIHRPTMTTVLQELHLAERLEGPTSCVEESFGPFDYSGCEMAPMAR